MSRLDTHVRSVRHRLGLELFAVAAASAAAVLAGAYLAALLLSRLGAFALPREWWLAAAAVGLVVLAGLVWALLRLPSRHEAAVKLDAALGLKEKFSTALLARGSSDSFAAASVADAEHTAGRVSLRRAFPLQVPRQAYWALTLLVAVALVQVLVPQMDLFGREQRLAAKQHQEQQLLEARKNVEKALVELASLPRVESADPKLQAAKAELEELLKKPIRDPAAAATTAQKALQDAQALRDRIKDNQKVVNNDIQKKMFERMLTSEKPFSQLDEVHKTLSNSDWAAALSAMQDAADKFDRSDAKTREQMEKEMGAIAESLEKMASDPNVEKNIAEQLNKMGANKDQTRDLMNEMERAAAGDKEAADRLKNMAENLARQNNGGKLPAPEELADLMQKVRSMQGQMAAQQNADAMAQAAEAVQKAMQQSNQAQANQGGNPQQQAEANAQAREAMKNALSQMQQAQKDAEAAAAQQQAGNQPGGDKPGQGQWGQGQMAEGQNPNPQQGNGPGGLGQGDGQRPEAPAPFDTKTEKSPGVHDERGRVLAGSFVKAGTIRGESREQLKEVITAAEHQQTDDIEQDRIPLSSQKVVKDYFNSLRDDLK